MALKFPKIGPGAVVAAAFIGPGTVTTCTLAGVRFGYALLWALGFATLGTMVLQEMSARLGVVGGIGLGEALRRSFDPRERPVLRAVVVALVVLAIGVGNAAYQTGNLLGATLGLGTVLGGAQLMWVVIVASGATMVLWSGSYRTIERVLVAMVVLMSVVFFITASAVSRGPAAIAENLLTPRLPPGSVVTAIGLIGTTIVPYNLFLHANAARERWRGEGALRSARADLVVSILLGGIVSMSILVTGAARPGAGVESAADMALALEPLLGAWAKSFLAVGLFAAGFTSAITAPLAAAFALSGIFGWVSDMRSPLFRGVWGSVMLVGAVFAALSTQPVRAILLAQAANGVLLPAIAIFLLVVMNDRRTLGTAANGWLANVLGSAVVLLTVLLGARLVLGALGITFG